MALFHHKAYLMLCPLGKNKFPAGPASSMGALAKFSRHQGLQVLFLILGSNMAVKYPYSPKPSRHSAILLCARLADSAPSSCEKPCTHLARGCPFWDQGQCLHQASGWPHSSFQPFFLHPAQEEAFDYWNQGNLRERIRVKKC